MGPGAESLTQSKSGLHSLRQQISISAEKIAQSGQQQTSNSIGGEGSPSWDSNAASSTAAPGLPAPMHGSAFQNRVTIDDISMVGGSDADEARPSLRDGAHTRAPNRSLAGGPQRTHKR